jgi:hypothetical protein
MPPTGTVPQWVSAIDDAIEQYGPDGVRPEREELVGTVYDPAGPPPALQVSRSGWLMSRRGDSSSVHASGVDAHCDSIAGRVDCDAAGGAAAAAGAAAARARGRGQRLRL